RPGRPCRPVYGRAQDLDRPDDGPRRAESAEVALSKSSSVARPTPRARFIYSGPFFGHDSPSDGTDPSILELRPFRPACLEGVCTFDPRERMSVGPANSCPCPDNPAPAQAREVVSDLSAD